MSIPRMEQITCVEVLDSLRNAVRSYIDDDEIYQTDLKPLSVLLLADLYDRCYGKRYKNVYFHVNAMKTDNDRKWVLRRIRKDFHVDPYECVVDFNIMRGKEDPFESLITGESEAYFQEAVALSRGDDDEENDMLWDLYKLLHYPSPLRFFVTLSSVKHHKILLRKTSQKISAYSKILGSDDIFAVQVPTGRLSAHDCTVACWSGKYPGPRRKAETSRGRLRDQ
jgi:hypothetical protein